MIKSWIDVVGLVFLILILPILIRFWINQFKESKKEKHKDKHKEN